MEMSVAEQMDTGLMQNRKAIKGIRADAEPEGYIEQSTKEKEIHEEVYVLFLLYKKFLKS